MKRYLYFVTFVAALGSLLVGFETGVINGTIFYVAQYFGLSPAMKGFVVSVALIGCVIGALFVGKPADIYGRRYILRYMALFFLASMLLTGLATNLWMFIVGRFIDGIAVGGASVVTPMYINALNSWVFPVVVVSIGTGYAFLFSCTATILSLIFYRFALVETKGKSLEEIERMVLGKKS